MIQIYKADNTNYENNGDMTLVPSSASVHVILNGSWSAEIVHPIDQEERWSYISEGAVVKMPSFNGEQLFRIKQKEKKDSGVTATLEPIFYDSMDDCFLVNVDIKNKTGQQALGAMTAPNSKYSGKSNITRKATTNFEYKNLMEALNGDDENSFINCWGGEMLFDNFQVIVNEKIGGDFGAELRYGKNIPVDGLTEEVDVREVVTRIYPKAYNGYPMTGNGHVDSTLLDNYPIVKCKTMTFDNVKMSEDAQEEEDSDVIICKNQSELDAALKKKCQEQYEAGLDKPTVTIRADMILLKDTELYKDYEILETVSLGDVIHCYHSGLNIITDARVTELEYDSIRGKVTSVVLGDFSYNYFDNVSSAVDRIDGAIRPDGSLIAEQVQGILDGVQTSLKLQSTIAKKVNGRAFTIEDLDPDSELYGCMQAGTQGLQIAYERTADGRDWDWRTAITARGIVADAILTGLLSDKTGKNYWDLETGKFHAGNGTFEGTMTTKSGDDEIRVSGGRIGVRYAGELLGYIGANKLQSSPNTKGIVFDLDTNGDYISWAYRKKPSDRTYTMILTFSRTTEDGFTANALNLGCDMDMRHYKLRNIKAENGYSGWDGEIPIVTKIQNNGDGTITWYFSSIDVSGGIITSAPRSKAARTVNTSENYNPQEDAKVYKKTINLLTGEVINDD